MRWRRGYEIPGCYRIRGVRWALGREPVGVPQLRCTSIAYGTRAPRENGRNWRRGCAPRHSVCPRRRSDELGICVGRVRAPLTGDVVHAQGDEADHHRGVRENDRDGQLARLRRFHGRDIPRDRVHDAYRRARAPRAMREKGCSPADTNSLERRKNFHPTAQFSDDLRCPKYSGAGAENCATCGLRREGRATRARRRENHHHHTSARVAEFGVCAARVSKMR